MRALFCFSFNEFDRFREKILIATLSYSAISASLALAHGDTSLVSPPIRTIFVYTQYLAIFLIFLFTYWRNLQKKSLQILIPFFIYYTFYLFDSSPFLSVSINFIAYFPLVLIAFQSTKIQAVAFLVFYKTFVLISVLGIIASVSFIFNLGLPYEICPYYGGENYYVNFYFAYLYWGGQEGLAFRLCGLCNEPGALGTILALLLVVQKFNLKKVENVLLVIAGFFTFSAAFYAISFVYIFFLALKKVLIWIPIAIITILLAINISNIEKEIPFLSHLIERFEYDSKTGKFKGDNRTSQNFDNAYEELFESALSIFFGYGTNSHSTIINVASDSYKVIIYQYGFIGLILIYLSFFIIRVNEWMTNRNALYFTILLMISIYQRPRIFMATYFLLYYGGIDYIVYYAKEKKMVHLLRIYK